ncbi:LPS-assembly protein LptD [Verrucomicrobiaceae bacterium N1E253]|uniref:LPS-assembly protein LptD n=1 Tax=Oceaniferula marina TaxID=2748318 RepID=A0A851GG32_9BACT|nr:LPS-assembly protein LptD [Oceaniferula marina]NWK56738.1 LPS-assembly protein LptD [Oceaniferula marina]
MKSIRLGLFLYLLPLSLIAQEPATPPAPNKEKSPDENKDPTGAGSLLGDDFAGMPDMPSLPDSIRVTNDGKLEFDTEKGTYLFEGNVHVHGDNGLELKAGKVIIYAKQETATLTGNVSVIQKSSTDETGRILPGVQLFADKVLLNAKTKLITLDGNVSVYQGPTLHRGEHAAYNYESKKLDTTGLGSKLGPIVLESDQFEMVENQGKISFIGKNAGITTHDVAEPNYWIRSEQTTIYPDDKIIFKNMKLYAGETPVFWFPYLSQPLDADLGLHILPGARSNWGAYILSSYGIMLGGEVNEETGEKENAWLLSKWHLDLMSKRGIGAGLDLHDTRLKDNENLGWLKYYYLNDRNPSQKRTDESRGFVNEDRWKFELKYRHQLFERGQHQTYADVNMMALSDRYYLEDFEPGTYKINPNPNNEIGIFHRHPRFLAGFYTRFRPNDFYQSDTRLPELFLDQVRAPVFSTPVLHEGQTTLGIYREYLDDDYEDALRDEADGLTPGDPKLDIIDGLLEDKGYTRFHTWQEFSIPFDLDGKVSITPRAGAGVTSYWDVQDDTDSFTRTHFAAAVDASMKFTRVFPDVQSQSWGLDGLLHILQPYASFSQVATNNFDNDFRGIETLAPSTRPPPLEVGRFPATDDLADWSILRLGTRNILLSRRDGDSHRWLALDTYIDVFLNDLEANRSLSNLYNDLVWQPLPWMKLNLETQFPVAHNDANFSELTSSFTFMPNNSTEFQLGYRILDNHPTLQDSHRLSLRSYLRLNDEWGLGTYHRYEFDDNTLEIQQYAVHRDFDSWRTSLGFLVRDNRDNNTEYGLMLNFTLKNFPSVRVPLSIDAE